MHYSHMTMDTHSNTIGAGEFKARCLALLDEVAASGRTLVITKRGRPVAQLAPLPEDRPPSLRGSVVWEGDIVSPTGEMWEVEE